MPTEVRSLNALPGADFRKRDSKKSVYILLKFVNGGNF